MFGCLLENDHVLDPTGGCNHQRLPTGDIEAALGKGGSEWLNGAFWMAIDNISEWSYSCAVAV